ncbi:unnamed protein product [Lathyrus oleraceus]
MVESKAGKLNKSKKEKPRRLSCGRYRKLEKTMIVEKRQQLGDRDSMSRDQEPSPPSLHEKWKRTRLRPNGDYTSDASKLVVERIISRSCCAYV